MFHIKLHKVPEGNRSLPIFAEADRMMEQIRKRAFDLSTAHGFDPSKELDDWIAAEHEFCWAASELAESDEGFTLEVALAGFEPNEISVAATPCELVVTAAKKSEEKQAAKGEKVVWTEFHRNEAFRRVELPVEIDVDRIVASYRNGLLKIVAPKAATAKAAAKPIEVPVAA